jgi:serine/threonine-protein kinase
VRAIPKAVIEIHDEHARVVDQAPPPERASGIERIERIDRGGAPTPVPNTDSPVMRELGLRTGTLVDGVYRLVRPLGAGGMGVVTLARDERLDRYVAIKFIRPELFRNQAMRDLFETEARLFRSPFTTRPTPVCLRWGKRRGMSGSGWRSS